MNVNPIYTHTITQTITFKDVYGDWATVQNILPVGYEVVDFRPAKAGEVIVGISTEVYALEVYAIHSDCPQPRLIVKKSLAPIIFNPSLFGAEAVKLYGTDNIMLKVGYCLYGFMPKLSVGKGNVWALSPECKNMCPKEDIQAFYQSLIWIYKEF